MYKIDSQDNDAKTNAKAFTQIVQQTHMYSLDCHITVETNKDTEMKGIHLLKQTVNLNIIEHNRENPGVLERFLEQVIRASRIFSLSLRMDTIPDSEKSGAELNELREIGTLAYTIQVNHGITSIKLLDNIESNRWKPKQLAKIEGKTMRIDHITELANIEDTQN